MLYSLNRGKGLCIVQNIRFIVVLPLKGLTKDNIPPAFVGDVTCETTDFIECAGKANSQPRGFCRRQSEY